MTEKQRHQFNRMRLVLKKISKYYQTPDQLRRNCEKDYGLGYQESLEMAYENLQSDAQYAVKGVKEMRAPKPKEPRKIKAVAPILTALILLSSLFSHGQTHYEGKTVYDTVPCLLQISDTTWAGHIAVTCYKGFAVYKNELSTSSQLQFSYYPASPERVAYLRNDGKPLPRQYFVWMSQDLRQCRLQPIRGL